MPETTELKFRRFHDLMPHRVREVLLVSTPYDAFILEEDGQLTEQIFFQYSELNLSAAPRVIHVETAADALNALRERPIDLVIATRRTPDVDVFRFASDAKQVRGGVPVVILAMDDDELRRIEPRAKDSEVDAVFLWTGDARILLAAIKFIEDRRNAVHDTRKGVRAIIVVEDSVRFYSVFLGMLYSELMHQSQSLIAEGLNDLHRLMRMRARPKILLATTYEEAIALYDKFRRNALAIISDIRFPKDGELDPGAGQSLLTYVRQDNPTLPVVLQSAEPEGQEVAGRLGALFCDKNDRSLLKRVASFLSEDLGFGPFVFRMPGGTEIARAANLFEFEDVLAWLPAESLEYHARLNHISVWLMARGEFDLARELRPKKVSDFPTIEELRAHLTNALRALRRETQQGVISDFTPENVEDGNHFLRIGGGSLGGKARGIAFVNAMLARRRIAARFPGMDVMTPRTVVIATDAFERFMDDGNLYGVALGDAPDEQIQRAFCAARLPEPVRRSLRLVVEKEEGPLAVRSSSLLEDSQFRPFAGIYRTVMLPNSEPDPDARLEDLCRAVKLVYASTYCRNAKAYMEQTPNRVEDERMAVVIQRVTGRRHGDRFYPTFAGVAQSYNYYPVGRQRPGEGIAQVVLGLGKTVVEGGVSLRFSPAHPQALPQFGSAAAIVKNSQTRFLAVDMAADRETYIEDPALTVRSYSLREAEDDRTLHHVGAVYDAADDIVRDSLDVAGPRVVTFAGVLKHGSVPLPDVLRELLDVSSRAMGTPVEIEFSVDMGDTGRRTPRGKPREKPTFYLLQLRPMLERSDEHGADPHAVPEDMRLCFCTRSMGFGCYDTLRDVVYVRRDTFDRKDTRRIADEIGRLNQKLAAEKRSYILAGPGRWGSADPWLGIPVQWAQISAARVMVEASPAWFQVDPSQGTHFFQNITSLRIGYLTLPPGADDPKGQGTDYFDWTWLDQRDAEEETDHLRHLRFDEPLVVHLNGRTGQGVIAKPGRICER